MTVIRKEIGTATNISLKFFYDPFSAFLRKENSLVPGVWHSGRAILFHEATPSFILPACLPRSGLWRSGLGLADSIRPWSAVKFRDREF